MTFEEIEERYQKHMTDSRNQARWLQLMFEWEESNIINIPKIKVLLSKLSAWREKE